ncbi:hypothetical protein [Arthrobacter sp. IK3]|uniref:hypothetical protein n=1 Tax=Arthrobacter sp. IK3 TaxID=3448169 RepID=UPI003EDED26A
MTAAAYIPFDARLNIDGTVNIFADGIPLPGGQGLGTADAVRVLSRYARENGTVLMSTVQLNGTVTRDIIDGTGTAVPYYDPTLDAAEAADEEAGQLEGEEVLMAALKTRGAVPGAPPAAEYTPRARSTRRVQPLEAAEAIPDFDVEGDLRKALAARKNPVNVRAVILLVIGVIIAAAAAAAFYAVSGSLFAADLHLPEVSPPGLQV